MKADVVLGALKDLPYYQEIKNTLRTIPGLLVASVLFYSISLFSYHTEVNMSDYLGRA